MRVRWCAAARSVQRSSGVPGADQGQASLAATFYEMEKPRCNLCGNLYTAAAPDLWSRRAANLAVCDPGLTAIKFVKGSASGLLVHAYYALVKALSAMVRTIPAALI